MVTRGERHRLTIERPAAGGRMIARHDGAVVLVAGAIPGEVVEAEIEKVQRGTVWAIARTILEPSPDRVAGAPDGACGGSVFAHIAYDRQRQIKAAIVEDALRRIGRITLDAPVAVVPSPVDGHRMRARLHARDGRIGFFREGTHSLCDAAATRQLRDDTLAVLGGLAAALAGSERPAVSPPPGAPVTSSSRPTRIRRGWRG
jgi:tRNA/tmRNA/rRNA uracil-C5-methylase (TrmA/RlmC/RlmD family)